ncbi:hypothetical protein CRUP_012415 [Coryphaenoides rupestris]|nr:hypothetical protein CRUP_012415 [Coryphaenoides rupestris]
MGQGGPRTPAATRARDPATTNALLTTENRDRTRLFEVVSAAIRNSSGPSLRAPGPGPPV